MKKDFTNKTSLVQTWANIVFHISKHVNFFVGGFSFNLVNLLKVWFRSQIHNISALIIFFICTPNPRD